jgi:hypothetical protein
MKEAGIKGKKSGPRSVVLGGFLLIVGTIAALSVRKSPAAAAGNGKK